MKARNGSGLFKKLNPQRAKNKSETLLRQVGSWAEEMSWFIWLPILDVELPREGERGVSPSNVTGIDIGAANTKKQLWEEHSLCLIPPPNTAHPKNMAFFLQEIWRLKNPTDNYCEEGKGGSLTT